MSILVLQPSGKFTIKTTLADAAAAADAAGKTIICNSPQTLTSDLTLASDRAWRFDKGCLITTTGHTLNINHAPVIIGDYQVFAGSGVIGLGEAKPVWWGAKDDGTTDSYPAIQYSINSGASKILFGQGKYLINSALNVTNLSGPIKFVGVSAPFGGNAPGYQGSTIVGNTGTWMADFTGSSFVDIEDILFLSTAASSTPSKAGLLFARSVVGQYVLYSRLKKVYVYVPSFPSFTSVGSIALFGDNTENQVVEHCWFEADTAYATTLNNDLSISSVYSTISTAITSNTDVSHRQNVYKGIIGAAMLLIGQASSTYDQCFWQKANPANTYNYAIVTQNSSGGYQTCQKLNFTGQVECYNYAYLLTHDTTNIHINITTAAVNQAFVRIGSDTNHYGLEVNAQAYTRTANKRVLDATSASIANLYGGRVVVADGGKLDSQYIKYIGTDIQMAAVDTHDNAQWNYAAGSTYRMLSATTPLSTITAMTPGTIVNGATFSGGATCPGARLGDSVQVSINSDLQGCSISGYVSSSDNVVVTISNNTGSSKTFSSANAKFVVSH